MSGTKQVFNEVLLNKWACMCKFKHKSLLPWVHGIMEERDLQEIMYSVECILAAWRKVKVTMFGEKSHRGGDVCFSCWRWRMWRRAFHQGKGRLSPSIKQTKLQNPKTPKWNLFNDVMLIWKGFCWILKEDFLEDDNHGFSKFNISVQFFV